MTVEPTEIVRSEERLTVTTEVVPYARARLRVETTTEEVLVPVTITRQHARVEYVDALGAPVTGVPDAQASPWVTLHVDEPVVTTRPVAVERVRLVTGWVAGAAQVQAQVAHEEFTTEVTGGPAQRG